MKKSNISESQKDVLFTLKDSDQRYRTIMMSIGDAVIATDTEGKVEMMNPVAEQLTGWSQLEAMGKPVESVFCIVTEETFQPAENPVQIVMKHGLVVGLANHTVLIDKEGKRIPIYDSGAPIRNENGDITGVVLVFRDQTQERALQKTLSESEEKFRIIFEHTTVGKSLTLPDGKLFGVNKAFAEMLGRSQEEMHLVNFSVITHPDDVAESRECIRLLLANERQTYRMEKRYLHKNGKYVWTDVSTTLLRDHNGNPKNFITSITDITARKLAEETIKGNEKRFRELIESLPQLFWTCRVDGPCDYLSKQWVDYTGIPDSEQLGYRWLEQLHPDDRDKTVSEWMEKVKSGESFDIEFRIRRNDSEYRWFKTRAVPMRDPEGNIIKWFGSNTDFDEIKKAEEQLINFSKELEQKVEERTKELEAFSYSVSHDLRAPLRHVSGYVELLNKHFQKELSGKGLHYLNSISGSVHLMGKLIDDLLRFSRTGRMEMVKSVIDMDAILQEVRNAIAKDNAGRNIEWIIRKLPKVYGDGSMLHLVWSNLLSNAVKFTGTRSNPRIEIGANDDKKEWEFYVKDNGVGFDMQYAHKLFGVFQRLHPTEEYEGTGIGLANVRRIISRHGGRTWAEAEPDKGAIFNFSLPKYREEL
jgi:PAS domain S-box-containing protein